jgi:predicted ATP-grasp superfamily ATP-dependent carboligase
VLKPVSAYQWRAADAWKKVGARKAVRIDNSEQLVSEYNSLSSVCPQMLAQEWISGSTEQIVVLGGYADAKSDLLAYFTARKIVQSPNDCGTGCIVQSEPLPELVAPTRRLLKALRYHGMAEVEYKFDVATHTHKLIEINTRHWDQHELGLASGVNLTWVAYCDHTGRESPACGSTVPATWVAEDTLLMRLCRSLFREELRIPNLREKLSSGPRVFGIFAASDPIPFFNYCARTLVPGVGRAIFARMIKGRQTPDA